MDKDHTFVEDSPRIWWICVTTHSHRPWILLGDCARKIHLPRKRHQYERNNWVSAKMVQNAFLRDGARRGQSGGKMASVRDGPFAAISPSWHTMDWSAVQSKSHRLLQFSFLPSWLPAWPTVSLSPGGKEGKLQQTVGFWLNSWSIQRVTMEKLQQTGHSSPMPFLTPDGATYIV